MGSDLPLIERDRFTEEVRSLSPVALPDDVCERLFAHYQELCRWNPRLSLVGPGDRDRILERHYGESLAALEWVGRTPGGTLVDVGSGGGFPGWVLAAARPEMDVYLVEPKQRKWSFLRSAASRGALSVRCLNARVDASLPDGLPETLDVVTVRALKLDRQAYRALAARMPVGAKLLLWQGERDVPKPEGFEPARSLRLRGSDRRELIEQLRAG